MVMSSIVKQYLNSRDIPNYCRNEEEYRYHVELENSSRITGCEMVIRTVGAGVMLTAILPIKIRPKEARGLIRTLANYNADRTAQTAKQGFFELDYIENKIQFRLKVKNTLTESELEDMIDFCLTELQEASDLMMRLVCEESDLVWKEEQEEKRRQELASRPESPVKRTFKKLMGLIGLEDEAASAGTAARLAAPVQENNVPQTTLPESFESKEETATVEDTAVSLAKEPIVSNKDTDDEIIDETIDEATEETDDEATEETIAFDDN